MRALPLCLAVSLFVTSTLLAPAALAQADADAIMDQFAAAWTADDVGAVRQMLADDVVIAHNDLLLDSPDAVVAEWGPDMATSGTMTITPIRSGATSDALYQVGRWTLESGGSVYTGTHHFTFRETPDGEHRLVAAHIRTAPDPEPPVAAGVPADVMMDRFVAAWNRGDLDAVSAMMADDVVFVDAVAWADEPLAGREAVTDYLRPLVGQVELDVEHVRSVAGGPLGVSTGRWTIDGSGGEGAHTFVFRDGRIALAHIEAAPPTRAAAGETAAVIVHPVRADKREQYEAYIRDFQAALADNVAAGRGRPGDQEAYEQTRWLTPARPNAEGHYEYVIIADPVAEDSDYEMLPVLRLRYDDAEAERQYALFHDALAGPQQVIVLRQSER